MSMTHYMELLAASQPWNLIIYMVIPVALAEALVAMEFVLLFRQRYEGTLRQVHKIAGIVLGVYFFGIMVQLGTQVLPNLAWRGPADVLAVGSYLLAGVPLVAISLLELGVWGGQASAREKMKYHFLLLTAFLIITHVAMVFGMVDPTIMGWQPQMDGAMMQHGQHHGQ